jgi:hypothetical protein
LIFQADSKSSKIQQSPDKAGQRRSKKKAWILLHFLGDIALHGPQVLLSAASGRVLALVSGLPPGKRERRFLMTLQAYIDDSGADETSKHFVLAGFIAPYEKWIEFSVAWAEALTKPPGAAYLKMSEAFNLSGEFSRQKGWTDRLMEERIDELANIIRNVACLGLSAAISHSAFDQVMKSRRVPVRRFATDFPHIMLAERLLLHVIIHSPDYGLSEPCDFIFDEQQGVSTEMALWWPSFRKSVERSRYAHARNFLGAQPIFRSETDFVPLQAADLFRRNLDGALDRGGRVGGTLAVLLSVWHNNIVVDGTEIERINTALDEAEQKFLESHPGFPLAHLSSSKRERKKARKNPMIPS